MKNRTLYKIVVTIFTLIIILLMGCRYFKGGLYDNQTNSDTTKQVYFDTGDLEPGEYGLGYDTLKIQGPIFAEPDKPIKNPNPILNEDSSFWCYYNHSLDFNNEDRDSLKNWIKNFNPINQEREIKNLIKYVGDNFFTCGDDRIFINLMGAIQPGIDENTCQLKYWWGDIEDYFSYRTQHSDSLEGPLEQIWKEDNLFFSRNPYYNYTFNSNWKSKKIFSQIKKIKIQIDTATLTVTAVNQSQINTVKKEIQTINDEYAKCTLYFLLWHKLYCYNLADSSWDIINRINTINSSSTQLTRIEKADWNMAIAKILASVNFEQYSLKIFEYLKSVQKLLEIRASKEEFTKSYKNELTRAMYWAYYPGLTAKLNALHGCIDEFRYDYNKLTEDEVSKFYYYTAFFWYIVLEEQENRRNIKVPYWEERRTSQRQFLWFANNVFNIHSGDHYDLTDENCTRFLNAMVLYNIKDHQYKTAKKWCYLLLDDILYKPKRTSVIFNIENVYNLIQKINVELEDSIEYQAWNQLFGEFSEEMSMPLSSHSHMWTQEQLQDNLQFILNTPIDTVIGYYEHKWLKKFLSDKAHEKAIFSKDWKTGYELLAKSDSIEEYNYDKFYFDLGYIGNAGYSGTEIFYLNRSIDSLSSTKRLLQNNVNAYKDSIQESKQNLRTANDSLQRVADTITAREARIVQLDSAIKEKESKIGTLTFLNKVKNIALIVASVLLFAVIGIAIFANRQRTRAIYEAAINKYRSSMSFLDKHLISNVGALLKSHVRKGHPEEAASLIDDFTSLNRSLLLSLTSLHTTLYDEIKLIKEFLTIYTKTENNFNFNIHTPENWQEVQSMGFPYGLLQLFCENSLKHGLKYKPNEYSKTIDIIINHNSVGLDISIIDNGVGREVAKLRAKRGEESFGNAIAQSKVEGYNKIKKADFDFHYPDDRYGADGICLGTSVSIKATKYEIENTNIDSR